MGIFYVGCRIENHVDGSKTIRIPKLLVDTGSEFTWISETTLRKIGVEVEKKDIPFAMANGQTITRNVGFLVIKVNQSFTIDEVVFAIKGDYQLLGSRALEGLNLAVDSRNKKLVASGPIITA